MEPTANITVTTVDFFRPLLAEIGRPPSTLSEFANGKAGVGQAKRIREKLER